MLRLHVKSVNVVKPAIPGFRHYRQAPPIASHIRCAVFDAPGNCRVPGYADTMCVSDDERPFQKSAFFYPRGTGHLAISVQAEDAGINRIIERIVSARDNCGNSSSDWTFAGLKFPFAFYQSGITHFYAVDIANRVKFARSSFERNAKI